VKLSPLGDLHTAWPATGGLSNQDKLMKFKTTLWTALLASTLTLSAHAADDKKDLVQKLLAIQQVSLDATAKSLAENPARQMIMAVQPVLTQAVPPEKREATAKAVDAEIKKYLDAATPIVKVVTNKASQSAVAPMLEEKFTEDELRQLVSILDNPALKKYQGLLPEMNKVLVDKVLNDARPQVDPKLQTAQDNVRKILDTASGGKLSQAAAQHSQQMQAQQPKKAAPAAPAKK
jgi:uncharacterized protein